MASSGRSGDNETAEVKEYYCNTVGKEVQRRFKNLDDAADAEGLLGVVQSSKTWNFALDFSDAVSWAAFDLAASSIAALLETERPESLNTRWINIWYPSQQRSLIEVIARRYDFSPRLLALMCSEPKQPRRSQSSVQRFESTRRFWHRRSQARHSESEYEKGLDELSEHSSISSHDSAVAGNLYKMIDDLWHYSSIDFGRNYVCIGYNSLYGTKHAGSNDNTVISINEDPFPFSQDKLDPLQQRILVETRRNLVNVLRSLSNTEEVQSPMSLLPLRARLGDTPEESVHRLSDTPGLLFYYLFENWQNSYTLITRRESRYGLELNSLRKEMFQAPKLCHIDRLDTIGKELGLLKRHYESYNRIIDRLLEPQTATSASLANSRIVGSETSQMSVNTVRAIMTERESMLGVSLTSATRARFKRLCDLIDLYALSEIEGYIKQKDSLVMMNFNLIAIKESLDVERLTRITLLLTKVTIVFLPVSLMTAYFSVPLQSMVYSAQDYWVSFAVTIVVSCLALVAFGLVSGTVQTGDVWRAVWRALKRGGQQFGDKIK
ncbi:hypothetical protein LTR37_011200 [Vermiconidia calcicola]|uniref:Uncharacterized protein n=1 Tax=Vermiconidia calcicola TaxID=1690605 RepID=A0ACC3N4A1_9PEZI|nr:hypothetical protein LTR37_011200 [Vermiconidia calcicola]